MRGLTIVTMVLFWSVPTWGQSTLDERSQTVLRNEVLDYFNSDEKRRDAFKFSKQTTPWLRKHEDEVKEIAWRAFQKSKCNQTLEENFDKKQVAFEDHLSPYTVKTVGKRPKQGWNLFIAMHGGGNVPKRVNDSQWRHMQIYYRDQKDVPGYKYVALRAPNDRWNGFYDNYVYPLIENLVRQFILYGDVDPNKVFIMGYSHGGYGAFAIGPKIPYRFAAVHASAAAPTDGQTSAKTLRNTRFSFMIGEKDTAYGRRKRCEQFAKQVEALKKINPDDYPVVFEFKKGFGHGGLPDRDKIREMIDATRDPVPLHLTWELTDPVVSRFYWLGVEKPTAGREIDATCRDNRISVKTHGVDEVMLLLDRRLVDFEKPLTIDVNGESQSINVQPEMGTLCESLLERGDIYLAYCATVILPCKEAKTETPPSKSKE